MRLCLHGLSWWFKMCKVLFLGYEDYMNVDCWVETLSILEILPSTLPDTITIYFPRRNANRKCNKIKLPGTVSLQNWQGCNKDQTQA